MTDAPPTFKPNASKLLSLADGPGHSPTSEELLALAVDHLEAARDALVLRYHGMMKEGVAAKDVAARMLNAARVAKALVLATKKNGDGDDAMLHELARPSVAYLEREAIRLEEEEQRAEERRAEDEKREPGPRIHVTNGTHWEVGDVTRDPANAKRSLLLLVATWLQPTPPERVHGARDALASGVLAERFVSMLFGNATSFGQILGKLDRPADMASVVARVRELVETARDHAELDPTSPKYRTHLRQCAEKITIGALRVLGAPTSLTDNFTSRIEEWM